MDWEIDIISLQNLLYIIYLFLMVDDNFSPPFQKEN